MKNFKLPLILLIFYSVFSCSKKDKQTIIRGCIPNLPDGILYLYKDDSSQRIDSVKTVNGSFGIIHHWKSTSIPTYLGIDHIDQKGILRSFNFPTNANYKKGKWESQFFMSDSLILINGTIKDFNLKDIKLPEKYRLVTSPGIKAGRQTNALFNIDGDLFENVNSKTIQIIKEKIIQYPDSYHLLYKINENKNSFSAEQVEDFLKSFKGDIVGSNIYKNLDTYNNKRFNENKISLPLLENNNGSRKEIINKKFNKHLIIFWASWCAPCRQEIPVLKKLYSLYHNDVEFVSISIDTNKPSWFKALKEEDMKWKQLVINNLSEKEALQIRFKLNQAIPYNVLVDNKLKILSSFTGLSTENELEKLIQK
ncbi:MULTISPECIES: TlpA disulfide reductase family protein [Chryseobacterium]|uniref:Thiol-disulfide isomerase/thioredoxin n=1 Tax=Chryseobacterium camelliae TaxID=1265445 RepID=A0ABU0TJE4_9FLAO|nr:MULTISPECIES: TlpA disulfide reductase family protein [Chryseobacterium]MDT3408977.1 thiol-disulfide isomerase/thioredoxin [Pseudacidovorax intermedius]MDQ1097166.1 thiol-disulfide isomerase/thioredoxin [Chryseobacterium camelliae]MDQ1101103.1 thiol-disulfide isomerase/thioredoxin [Chryseobacterium sp. SORGH_AS_1048]MDR6084546.1 thiol-disulfide isomerase/thioredoxin [Chryseobacterium sp. SORGH_AS_0909]MDR6132815.1 thiol-disulfide isomerase/thioredoxin [Chryseobacterium sp. SORGH_AS_1175]